MKGFLAALGNIDWRIIERSEIKWIVPFKDIKGVIQEDIGFHLSTQTENWFVISYWSDKADYLRAAIDLARTGNLRRTIDLGKLRVKPKTTSSDEDIFEKIEKLEDLKIKGILTEEQVEEKKKEFLAR